MSDLFWLSRSQLQRIEPYFPLAHGVPRVDDQRVISGIIHVIRNGLPTLTLAETLQSLKGERKSKNTPSKTVA